MIKQFASLLLLVMTACGNQKPPDHALHPSAAAEEGTTGMYTTDTKIAEVMDDPVFGNYGRLIFPADNGYYGGDTLGDLSLIWYTHIDPEKEDTGLFFFKGEPGAKFAVCNAGGAFAYVGAMHDSFPHALELSKQGYNAFALIYRPGAQTACEDLARAINFIFAHADELEVDTDCYSLWGGSAGARMAAWLGSYGPAAFGGDDLPRPGTVVMQYTGLSEYSSDDPHLCLRGRQRRHCQLAHHAAPSGGHVRAWYRHGVPLLSRPWSRFRPWHWHRGRGLDQRRDYILGKPYKIREGERT